MRRIFFRSGIISVFATAALLFPVGSNETFARGGGHGGGGHGGGGHGGGGHGGGGHAGGGGGHVGGGGRGGRGGFGGGGRAFGGGGRGFGGGGRGGYGGGYGYGGGLVGFGLGGFGLGGGYGYGGLGGYGDYGYGGLGYGGYGGLGGYGDYGNYSNMGDNPDYGASYNPYSTSLYHDPYSVSSLNSTAAMQPDMTTHVKVTVADPNAQVTVNGMKTDTKGTVREFQSPALEPGNYTYEIQATWKENGQSKTKTENVSVTPGSWKVVNIH